MQTERNEQSFSGNAWSSPLAGNSWDRRQQGKEASHAIRILEHAARYLALEQMRPDRIYSAGAVNAVQLIWSAVETLQAARVERQRLGREASAAWLPNCVITRSRRERSLAE